ncbi:hypothetical protein AVEN_188796-1 [Araneus ventricosus]|uniref:Uncharacterized protein n=1 Tax=Araneus ventricosus TaxID=182803 RepID=A0A4Y2BUA1_ARAVE|nr:hypothetical protein AVEN_188796-1 [Araneus ventricosus]
MIDFVPCYIHRGHQDPMLFRYRVSKVRTPEFYNHLSTRCGTVSYRTPPHAPVPDAITAIEPVDWAWDTVSYSGLDNCKVVERHGLHPGLLQARGMRRRRCLRGFETNANSRRTCFLRRFVFHAQ